ncbi:hypothetical protein [Bythopirellula polymerisocia]|uniref:Uncharacterized protein n=1 Tax=Bythopirellula polymerisocia TaxID=2528003 RepID=A0A5C6C6S3_9BACT|nr:hypothetical protein [Bythopirellula polymerisocia]TWU20333.1 hypothetical protein Pla144_49800 [Bythopirellula polymerisocia]
MLLAGIILNRVEGGNWGDLPYRYKIAAFVTYFGGFVVVLVGNIVVRVFL